MTICLLGSCHNVHSILVYLPIMTPIPYKCALLRLQTLTPALSPAAPSPLLLLLGSSSAIGQSLMMHLPSMRVGWWPTVCLFSFVAWVEERG